MPESVKKIIIIALCLLTKSHVYATFGTGGFIKDNNVSSYKGIGFDSGNSNSFITVGAGSADAYIVSYTTSGSNGYSSSFATDTPASFNAVLVDSTDNALCAGSVTITAQLEPIIARYITTIGSAPTLPAVFPATTGTGYIQQPTVQALWEGICAVPSSSPEEIVLVGQYQGIAGIVGLMKVGSGGAGTYGLNTNFGNSNGYIVTQPNAGAFDSNFNNGNPNTSYSPGGTTQFSKVTVDGSGNIVAVGFSMTGGVIAQFSNTGVFNWGVVDTTASSTFFNDVVPIVISSNTYYVVVGQTGSPHGLILCYSSTGSLKSGWGQGNGYVTDASANHYNGVAIDGQNRIIAVGTSSSSVGLITRYSSSGTVDGSFGASGYTTAAYANEFTSVALSGSEASSNEKIVAVGQDSTSSHAVVGRYNNDVTGKTDGSLDTTTFNTGGTPGYIIDGTTGSTGARYYNGVAIDGSGNIVVAGYDQTTSLGIVARYIGGTSTQAGTLDTTNFNSTSVSGGPGYANSGNVTNITTYLDVKIDTSGNIVIAAAGSSSGHEIGAVVRYVTTGILDTSFNGTGYVTYTAGSNNVQYNGIAIDNYQTTTNNIVAVGSDASASAVSRYIGYVPPTVSIYNDVAYDAGRTTVNGYQNDFILAVGNTPGGEGIVTSYTTAGAVGSLNLTTPPGTPATLNSINLATISSSTYYVVAGSLGASGYVGIMTQGGTAYTGFNGGSAGGAGGGSGYVTGTADGSTTYYNAIVGYLGGGATQYIVAVGTNGTNGIISVLNLQGGFLGTFNSPHGYVVSPTLTSSANAAIYYDVCLDSSGNVVVVGTTAGTAEGIIARYLPNGTLDATQITNSITQLVTDFNITTMPFFNSTTGLLSLTATTITGREGTPLEDITSFTTEVAGTFTNHMVNIDEVTEIDLSGNKITELPTGAFDGNTFTNLTDIVIDGNTVAMTIDATPFENFNGANNSGLTVSINGNSDLTALPAQLFSNTTTIGGLDLSNDGLTSVPSTLLTGITNINGNVLLEGNTGQLAGSGINVIPEGLFSGIVSTGNLNVSGLPLTELSLENATFEGTVNASGTTIPGVNDTALSNATIGTLDLNNSQVAAGNVSLFSMDSATINTITLAGTPVVSAAPANIQTQLNNGISSAALSDFLHSRESRDIITPLTYLDVADHYLSEGKSMGF